MGSYLVKVATTLPVDQGSLRLEGVKLTDWGVFKFLYIPAEKALTIDVVAMWFGSCAEGKERWVVTMVGLSCSADKKK